MEGNAHIADIVQEIMEGNSDIADIVQELMQWNADISDIVQELMEGNADIAVGAMTINFARESVIDFTKVIRGHLAVQGLLGKTCIFNFI